MNDWNLLGRLICVTHEFIGQLNDPAASRTNRKEDNAWDDS
jgi:hypothetical protein